jgi:predicted nucleic acid-binding protein
MSGIDYIADTNALLYIFKKNPCMKPYLDCRFGISVVTDIELLSFPNITDEEEDAFSKMIDDSIEFPLDIFTKNRAIKIRRTYGTKLPDAIVAATAIENKLPLVTADKEFKRIKELDLRLLEPKIP